MSPSVQSHIQHCADGLKAFNVQSDLTVNITFNNSTGIYVARVNVHANWLPKALTASKQGDQFQKVVTETFNALHSQLSKEKGKQLR